MAGEEVWLVDIHEQCVEVFSKPTADGYQKIQKFRRGESLAIQAFGDVKIFVDEILR
ncbi:Uma2 family endonuclease [Brasilonema sp. CT11]|nr:Uma2 family endonuclease [Brasilonema sp. CT11]